VPLGDSVLTNLQNDHEQGGGSARTEGLLDELAFLPYRGWHGSGLVCPFRCAGPRRTMPRQGGVAGKGPVSTGVRTVV